MGCAESIQATINEFRERGFTVLPRQFSSHLIEACRNAFWPRLLAYLESGPAPNRGPHRHFLPMPFDSPCFAPEFFFDSRVLSIVRNLMGEQVDADQWGCDVPLRGSEYQQLHQDYQRPLFPELPELVLPPYAIIVSFGLCPITRENGPIEIAPGTHRLTKEQVLCAADNSETSVESVPLNIGDVMIRHPWASIEVHRTSLRLLAPS